MAAKVGVATTIAMLVARYFDGSVLGLSTLALLVAMSDTNGGLIRADYCTATPIIPMG
jgi:2-keto-3-deoxygluconate permease